MNDLEKEDKNKLSSLSLSDAERLLDQDMDEVIGGDNYCTCQSFAVANYK